MAVNIKTKGVYDPNGVFGAAGWGALISLRGTPDILIGGPIDELVLGSTEAEAAAMAKAIAHALKLGIVETGDRVILFTDCRELVAVLLRLLPFTTNNDGIEAALSVRRALRESVAIRDIVLTIQRNRIDLFVNLERSHPDALKRARNGMNLVRARAI